MHSTYTSAPPPGESGESAGWSAPQQTPPVLAPPVQVPPASPHASPERGSPTEAREAALRAAVSPVFLPEAPQPVNHRSATLTPVPPNAMPGWPSHNPQGQQWGPVPHGGGVMTPAGGVWQQDGAGAAPQQMMVNPMQQQQTQQQQQLLQQQQMQQRQQMMQQQQRQRSDGIFGSEASRRRLPATPWSAGAASVQERAKDRPWTKPQHAGPRGEPAWHVLAQLFSSRGIPVDRGAPRSAWGELLPALVDEDLLRAVAMLQQGIYAVRFAEPPKTTAVQRFYFIACGPAGQGRRSEPWLFWCDTHKPSDRRQALRARLTSLCRVTAGVADSAVLRHHLIYGADGEEVLAGPEEKIGRPVELNPGGSLTLHFRDRDRPFDLCAADPKVYKCAARVFTAVAEANARAEALLGPRGHGARPPAGPCAAAPQAPGMQGGGWFGPASAPPPGVMPSAFD
eukprot:TRINITY_DN675_c3_g1_i1.p2 TRINITY_DN675_c3_g1~~TRINITY_DN675_c3_g1_i1.p2  ORF type:complete len:453 (+),score=130.08 TRINITY_DN675_c3_g1_i1:931-2289(+)